MGFRMIRKMPQLKTCPFCGCEAKMYPCGYRRFGVMCENCGAEGPEMKTEVLAAEAWNTRASTPPAAPVAKDAVEALAVAKKFRG